MSSTAREQKKLVNEYRRAMKKWQALLEEENEKRSHMIDASGIQEGTEPDGLREKLDEYVKDSGLLERQHEALLKLKESEQHLFAFFLDRATTPEEHEELAHLSRDYAGRITWLKQNFLVDGGMQVSDEVIEEVDLDAEIDAAFGDDDEVLLDPDD